MLACSLGRAAAQGCGARSSRDGRHQPFPGTRNRALFLLLLEKEGCCAQGKAQMASLGVIFAAVLAAHRWPVLGTRHRDRATLKAACHPLVMPLA